MICNYEAHFPPAWDQDELEEFADELENDVPFECTERR